MNRQFKLGKILWISGIFMLLIIIFIMMVVYKVKWENYDNKKYLYFYDCLDSVCVTEDISDIEESTILSKYECDDTCPKVKGNSDLDNTIILTKDDEDILFNYTTGKVVTEE